MNGNKSDLIGSGSIFFLGLGLVSTLTLTIKQRSLKRRDPGPGPVPDPGPTPRFTYTHSQVRSVTFHSDLAVYYWVVRKGQTQDELRL